MNTAAALAVELAARFYGITVQQAMKRQTPTPVRARRAAWAALAQGHGWTATMIGKEYGFNVRTVANLIKQADPEAVEYVRAAMAERAGNETDGNGRLGAGLGTAEHQRKGEHVAGDHNENLPGCPAVSGVNVHTEERPRNSNPLRDEVAFECVRGETENRKPARVVPRVRDSSRGPVGDAPTWLYPKVGGTRGALMEMLKGVAR